MFVAADKAVRARLKGTPHDRFGNPVDPVGNPGIRIPFFERKNRPDEADFRPFDVVPNRWVQVPIFNKTEEGRLTESIYPCVVFDLISVTPSQDGWLPPVGKNKRCLTGTGADVDVQNQQGVTVASGKSTNRFQPLGEPQDLMYQIELVSQVEYEAMFMLRALNRVFPTKGSLTVDTAGGTPSVLDMLIQGDITLTEPGVQAFEGAPEEAEETRERRYIATYVVEGFIDTSWDYYTDSHPAITGFELEMADKDHPDAEDVTSQAGVLEVIDLTNLMKP